MLKRSAAALTICAASFLLTTGDVYADETPFNDTSFRCGSDIISKGSTMHKIKDECGAPDSEQKVSVKKTYTTRKGKQVKRKKRGAEYMTEWVYKRDFGMYVLTFEGSRLIKKEYFKE